MITRSHIEGRDPGAVLAALKGPAFAAYREQWARAEAGQRPDHPLHLDVDVTTACNFRCVMCPAGGGQNFPGFQKGLFLPRALYSRALAEGQAFGLPSVRLGVTGEPLLVPDIADWAREAVERGVLDVALITNGSLLTPEASRGLIGAGLTRLMVSVDAASAATYARVRPGGHWDRLLGNIRAFLRLRAEMDSPTPLLRLSFIEMTLNEGEKESFGAMFAPLADYLSFQSYLNILGGAGTDWGLAGRARPQGPCPEPFTRLALHADGALFPCCADFGRQAPLGHLGKDTLLGVWRGEGARRLTAPDAMDLEPCRRCRAAA